MDGGGRRAAAGFFVGTRPRAPRRRASRGRRRSGPLRSAATPRSRPSPVRRLDLAQLDCERQRDRRARRAAPATRAFGKPPALPAARLRIDHRRGRAPVRLRGDVDLGCPVSRTVRSSAGVRREAGATFREARLVGVSEKRRPAEHAARRQGERERATGLDPDDEAARWLAEHGPAPEPPATSKSARKSKLLHQWRQRQQ